MNDWLPVAQTVVDFLERNPELRVLEVKLWAWVLDRLCPQSSAHFRTMAGGVGQALEQFGREYRETARLIREDR